jgi:hypothetical protein
MIAELRVEFGGGEPARQVRIQDERGNDKQSLFAEAAATAQVINRVGVQRI